MLLLWGTIKGGGGRRPGRDGGGRVLVIQKLACTGRVDVTFLATPYFLKILRNGMVDLENRCALSIYEKIHETSGEIQTRTILSPARAVSSGQGPSHRHI